MTKWKIKSFNEFRMLLASDPEFQKRIQQDAIKTITEDVEVPPNPLTWDKWIYRITVGGLVVIVLTIIICVVIMYGEDETGTFEVPDLFVSIGSGAIGAVAGLLTPTPTEKQEE